jgi:phage gp36-like protein
VSWYAQYSDLIARFDQREVDALISDTDEDELGIDAPNNPKLQAALGDASGDVEAALMRGGRYSISDLQSLTGNSLNLLARMTADIAMQYLLERRPGQDPDRIEHQRDIARRHLKRLASGEDIFNLQALPEAGQVHTNGPTIDTFINLHLIRDRTRHYYPHRRLPGAITRN